MLLRLYNAEYLALSIIIYSGHYVHISPRSEVYLSTPHLSHVCCQCRWYCWLTGPDTTLHSLSAVPHDLPHWWASCLQWHLNDGCLTLIFHFSFVWKCLNFLTCYSFFPLMLVCFSQDIIFCEWFPHSFAEMNLISSCAGEDCLAAGTEEVSQTSHICTKHLQLPKNISHHVNVNWCFCCSKVCGSCFVLVHWVSLRDEQWLRSR